MVMYNHSDTLLKVSKHMKIAQVISEKIVSNKEARQITHEQLLDMIEKSGVGGRGTRGLDEPQNVAQNAADQSQQVVSEDGESGEQSSE